MKIKIVILSLQITFITAFAVIASAGGKDVPPLTIEFADSSWNGTVVAANQQCQKFGGIQPGTPVLHITVIPRGADAIVMEYSDRDSEKMNNGGHGVLGYKLDAEVSEVIIPSLAGHTFEVAEPFYSIAPHRSPKWDIAGAYMPPCSGGKGHEYYVSVKAVKKNNSETTVLASTVFELGKY